MRFRLHDQGNLLLPLPLNTVGQLVPPLSVPLCSCSAPLSRYLQEPKSPIPSSSWARSILDWASSFVWALHRLLGHSFQRLTLVTMPYSFPWMIFSFLGALPMTLDIWPPFFQQRKDFILMRHEIHAPSGRRPALGAAPYSFPPPDDVQLSWCS